MSDQAARTLRPEDQISHYRIVGPLGAGGMGEVYRAQDQSLERSVALKILPPDLVRSEERVRRFVLEAKSASSLSHPNIVTIYEIGQAAVRTAGGADSGPVHFISMELVGGKTLSTLIHDDKTDLRTLLGYLAQAAEGLAKAHAAGIVHRDLKPGNIMVTGDGFAKVLDFGLAKLTEKREDGAAASSAAAEHTDATREGVVMGTAAYMSPEQVQGKAVDHRSDVFSFGCVVYEAATRRRPFAADSAIETMHKILHDKPTPVEELNGQAPAELRRLIKRCLAKSPDQRLQSMKDLALELREIVDEYETLSASASSGGSASLPAAASASRPPRLMWWGAAALLVLAGAAAAFFGLRPRQPERQPFQSMRLTTQTSRGDVLDSALSPDGRFLAYLAVRAGARGSLRVRQVATGSDVEVLPASEATVGNPSFSPDGNYVFYTASKPERPSYRALFQVPSLGGAPQERGFDVDSRVSFSPDGKQLVFLRSFMEKAESRLIVLDLASGKERTLAGVSGQERFQGAPSWSRDGKSIAALVVRPAPDLESTIALFDAASGRRQDLAKLGRTLLTSLAWLKDDSGLVSTGTDLHTSVMSQVLLHALPDGRPVRVTNDFNQYNGVTAAADDTIAAVRNIRSANLWIADANGAPARRITSIANPENSPGSTAALAPELVVYAAVEDRSVQLWSVATAKGEPRRLTSGEAHSLNPRAGRGVVFFDRLDASGFHVWRVGIDGANARALTSGPGEQAWSISPDGQHVLIGHFESPKKVSVIAQDGRVVFSVSDAAGQPVGFSPDSSSVLIGKAEKDQDGLTKQVWRVLPLAGGAPTATFTLPRQAAGLRWAPDSRGVTFLNGADPVRNVYRQAVAGGEPQQLTRFGEGRVTSHGWSPDGRRLAARIQMGDTSNLWLTQADGTRPLQVTQFPAEVFTFEWLPDSRGLVVNSGTSTWDAVLIRGFR